MIRLLPADDHPVGLLHDSVSVLRFTDDLNVRVVFNDPSQTFTHVAGGLIGGRRVLRAPARQLGSARSGGLSVSRRQHVGACPPIGAARSHVPVTLPSDY